MRKLLGESSPSIDDTAFVSKMAYIVGDVAVGPAASVWPFVCLRGDGGRSTTIGNKTNVQEFTMIHGSTVGDRVTIGHSAVIDYATVGDETLIGISSRILAGGSVGSNCIIAAGATVMEDQTIPDGHLAYGTPAITKPVTDDQRDEIQRYYEDYVELSARYKSEQEDGLETY